MPTSKATSFGFRGPSFVSTISLLHSVLHPAHQIYIAPAKRVMSLKRPEQKMSKSDPDPKSRILITDSPEEIQAKFRGAVTDSIAGISYDPVERPGVSNLVDILKHVTESRESSEYIAQDNANVSMRAFKEMIANEVITSLEGIRERFQEIMNAKNLRIRDEMEYGSLKARRKARMTMADVQQALGLNPLTLTDEEAASRRSRLRQMAQKETGAYLNVQDNPFEGKHAMREMEEDFGDEGDDDVAKGITLESLRRDLK